MNSIYYILGAIALYLLTSVKRWQNILKPFFEKWENFRANPYWDVNRYSWGYGTQAPGPTGTITPGEAWEDALNHLEGDYQYLSRLILRNLTANQWAALLSFSYNLGPGNADNLIYNINVGDDAALKEQWLQYVYAGGVYNANLAARRQAEWQLWSS